MSSSISIFSSIFQYVHVVLSQVYQVMNLLYFCTKYSKPKSTFILFQKKMSKKTKFAVRSPSRHGASSPEARSIQVDPGGMNNIQAPSNISYTGADFGEKAPSKSSRLLLNPSQPPEYKRLDTRNLLIDETEATKVAPNYIGLQRQANETSLIHEAKLAEYGTRSMTRELSMSSAMSDEEDFEFDDNLYDLNIMEYTEAISKSKPAPKQKTRNTISDLGSYKKAVAKNTTEPASSLESVTRLKIATDSQLQDGKKKLRATGISSVRGSRAASFSFETPHVAPTNPGNIPISNISICISSHQESTTNAYLLTLPLLEGDSLFLDQSPS